MHLHCRSVLITLTLQCSFWHSLSSTTFCTITPSHTHILLLHTLTHPRFAPLHPHTPTFCSFTPSHTHMCTITPSHTHILLLHTLTHPHGTITPSHPHFAPSHPHIPHILYLHTLTHPHFAPSHPHTGTKESDQEDICGWCSH